VTCKDWGDAWLNESFATFMESLYMEHSRGKNGYEQEIDNNMASYFAEARRYKRPISTKMYPNGDAMFDSHTYPKGGVVLHTLRRFLGDANFFAGLNLYLKTWRHTPVESAQLRRAMTEATGINCEPFWAQWFEKPGHPVLDYTWKTEGGKTYLNVKLLQDTTDGTPIYDINTYAFVYNPDGTVTALPVHLSKVNETFEYPFTVKGALVLDPFHDFLREIPNLHWSSEELPVILQFASNSNDRNEAMRRLMSDSPSEQTIQLVAGQIGNDNAAFPVYRTVRQLANLARPDLRGLWLAQLNHPNFDRRAEAVNALGQLPSDPATTQRLRSLINAEAPISVVVNAIVALQKLDKAGNADVFRKALTIASRNDRIKRAAQTALDAS
jgi:aminopeptidase N